MALIPRTYMDTLVTISVNNKNDEKLDNLLKVQIIFG